MRQRLVNTLLVSLVAIASGCCNAYTIDLQLKPSTMNEVFPVELMLLREYELPKLGFVGEAAAADDGALKRQIASWFQSEDSKQQTFQQLLLGQGRLVRIEVSLPHAGSKIELLNKTLSKVSDDTPVFIIAVANFESQTDVTDHFVQIRVADACKYTLVVDKNSINHGLIEE